MWSLKNRGFTLVEVMIAAAILVLIVSMLYAAFASSVKTMKISMEGGNIYRKAGVVLNRIAQEISCAELPNSGKKKDSNKQGSSGQEQQNDSSKYKYAFIGEDKVGDDIPQDTVTFISSALPLKGPCRGVKQVVYYCATDPVTDKLSLLMKEDTIPGLGNNPEQGGKGMLLAEGIGGLEFTYYDSDGREYKRWDSTSDEFGYKLPQAVRITIVFKDERGESFSLTTTTYIPLGGGD
jgi:prepilin-type N-terminal cleavage/methylation domain-containing protein